MSLQHQLNFTGVIYLASDHAGYEMKEYIQDELSNLNFKVHDLGAHEEVEGDDYPEFMKLAARAVADDVHARAVVFGGSGIGEALVMNRHKHVRCGIFYGPEQPEGDIHIDGSERMRDGYDIVRVARSHNNINALSLGARFITRGEALKACKIFLGTPFSGAHRHERRIQSIDD